MVRTQPDLLDRAVTGRLAGALAVPTDSRQQWQVRFLAREPIQGGIWVEPLGDSQAPLDSVIARGLPVEVALCQNHARHAFRTTIVRRNKHFWLSETMMFNALLLKGPVQLFPAERRANPRYQVPDGSHILAQIQCPGSFTPLLVRPWDLSAGGASFLCPRESTVTALKPDDVLQLKITHRAQHIAAKASVRFTRFLTDRIIKTGVRFDPDSIDPSSAHHLRCFLTDLQRLARPNPQGAAR
jgi:c-di-GMP-binding flagellar brake protein YcgR